MIVFRLSTVCKTEGDSEVSEKHVASVSALCQEQVCSDVME